MLIGIVGKPSSGKSTLFKAATLAEVQIAPYPFTTIKPNTGIGFVRVPCPERKFNIRCSPREGFCIEGNRFVPIQLLDVAGLVPGAHKGKGMGNQFLDNLRQAHALIHVIDAAGATNEKGEQVKPGSYDPAYDIRFLESEIDMWFLSLLKKGWDRFARTAQQKKLEIHKAITKQFSGLMLTEELAKEIIKELDLEKRPPTTWSDEQLLSIASQIRIKTKPLIIGANKADIPEAQDIIKRLKKDFPEYIIQPCCAEAEIALRQAARHGIISYIPGDSDFKILKQEALNEAQKRALSFIKSQILDKWHSTGIQQLLNKAVFDLLKLIAVFPVANQKLEDAEGRVLPDCMLLPMDSTALDLAFKIHTDLGKNFIKAIDIKTKRVLGKEHKLKNLDVVQILTER